MANKNHLGCLEVDAKLQTAAHFTDLFHNLVPATANYLLSNEGLSNLTRIIISQQNAVIIW